MQTFVPAANRPYPGKILDNTSLSDFVTGDLSTLYPIVVRGPKDALPQGVTASALSATVTGSNADVNKLLSVLTFRQVIGLLSQFTVTPTTNSASLSNPSYVVSGTLPTGAGTPAKYGGTLDTIFGKLCLYDIGELVAQATFQVNNQGSYMINATTDDSLGGWFVTDLVGPKKLGYLSIGLRFMRFSIANGTASIGSPVVVTIDSHKSHTE
jgi:hypothetical protein